MYKNSKMRKLQAAATINITKIEVMKNLKRLLNYKTRLENSDVRTYNAFTDNGGNDKRMPQSCEKKIKEHKHTTPPIHKPLKKLNEMKLKRKTDKISLNAAHQPETQRKSVAISISTAPAPAATSNGGSSNNIINYNSLNRMCNSTSSCCTSQSMQLKSNCDTNSKWRRWLHYCRGYMDKRKSKHFYSKLLKRCCQWQRCFNFQSGSLNKTDEYDDNIEAKVAAYLNEMKVKNAATKPPIDTTTIDSTKEAKAAAEELNRSPVMDHSSIDPSASPLQSRGSGSSDAWHGQSDEDIDRLVAMHQNRSSLSSLGLRSDSMASVYSGAGEGRYGTVVVKGQVEFGMQYNYKLAALEIHVVRCKDLAAVDSKRNRSDPYVKVYLLPDKSKAGKRKTKVKKHTLNPIFDEVLRFHMPIASLEARTLWLTVWHSDMFGRNDFLGEVSVNLQGRVFDNPQSQWYLLQERSEPFDEVATYRGDIVVGLKYVTPGNTKSIFMRSGSIVSGRGSGLRKFGSIKSVSTSKAERTAKGGQLHVLVKEAKHLTPIKPNGCCDAFCKSYLLPDRTRSSKQKTPVVKRSNNPSWTYTFIYEDVSLEDLSERALELTVWDHDRLASNEFLGGVRFSLGTGKSYGRQVDWMDASGKELSLWQNMLDRPNFWVEGSLILRSTLDGIRITP
uniref:C2 domain-containing protein n=1 Tax=Glossina austeni TaxID=7395 RepID=A0A1A9UM05_GLOAU